MTELTRVEGCLFLEGVRINPQPRRPTEESSFEFLDRVRQPAFERERSWWEAAYAHYPVGPDKKDVGRRFRSRDEAQHWGAAWELAQHELWSRLGWSLTPHPETPDARRRDFLVEHREQGSLYLECAVDLESSSQRTANQRWEVVEKALSSVVSPDHQLLIDVRRIGSEAIATRELRQEAQRMVEAIPRGQAGLVLGVDRDGWHFTVEAMAMPAAGPPVVTRGGVLSLEERLFNPIRAQVVKKARRSARLDRPFVVALLIIYPLPIVSKADVVQEALFGTTVVTLGQQRQALGESNRGDGIWFDGNQFRGTGVSALLLQEQLWAGQQLPTLHLHPGARRPLPARVPLEVCQYKIKDGAVQSRSHPATIRARDLFGLPEDWPGPEDWFEGINNDCPLPGPEYWTPRGRG